MVRVTYRRTMRIWTGVPVRRKNRAEILAMTEWCAETGSNAKFTVYVMAYTDSYHSPAESHGYAIFRFENENDAFAFKMRWR